jgi:hypothetical protein
MFIFIQESQPKSEYSLSLNKNNDKHVRCGKTKRFGLGRIKFRTMTKKCMGETNGRCILFQYMCTGSILELNSQSLGDKFGLQSWYRMTLFL